MSRNGEAGEQGSARMARMVEDSVAARAGKGPAQCWIMEAGEDRADELCRSLARGPEAGVAGLVALEFIEDGGAAWLDGGYFEPRTARQMYDALSARARALPEGAPKILAVDKTSLAGFGLANVMRALMLEEPGLFDAIVLADAGRSHRLAGLAPLCQRLGTQI